LNGPLAPDRAQDVLVCAGDGWRSLGHQRSSVPGTCAWYAAGGGIDGGQALACAQVLVLAGEAGVLGAEPDGVAGVVARH